MNKMQIIKHIETIFSISKAIELTSKLNNDDDWIYKVVKIDKNPNKARISITDEDGYFVGYL